MASNFKAEEKITQANLHLDFPLAECVRPFKLPKQFPSTLTESHSSQAVSKTKNISSKPIVKNISIVPSSGKSPLSVQNRKKKAAIFQKLKLKLPTGKDLDEIIIKKNSVFSNKIIFKSSHGSVSNIPRITEKSTFSIKPTIKTVALNSNSVTTEPEVVFKFNKYLSDENVFKSVKVKNPSDSISKIINNESWKQQLLVGNSQNRSQRVIFVQTNDKAIQIKDQPGKINNKTSLTDKKIGCISNESQILNTKKNLEKKFLETGNYYLKLKRPLISKQNISVNKKLHLDINNKLNKEIVLSSDEEDDQLRCKRFHKPEGNITIKKVTPAKLITTNNYTSFYKIEEKDNNLNICNSKCMKNNKINIENFRKFKLNKKINNPSDKIKILKNALACIEDKKLREEAIESANDCGIKVTKIIAIKPFSQKLINESTTQTDIFSHIRKEKLINVEENYKGLKLIKLDCKSKNMDEQSTGHPNMENKLKNNWNLLEFDRMLDKFDSKYTKEVKKTLKKKKVFLIKTILKQLENDFERAKNPDKDGFYAIHRAVLNNNFNQVKRSLTILRACNLSVDIESQDFKTSLELAIEFEVNTNIIKVLLDAGAQPLLPKVRHDSALTLAARKTLKNFFLLLNYIKCNQFLINEKDSDGLAPIHYCAQAGNLKGIIKLVNIGADVNLQDDKSGRTALFYAIESRNHEVSQDIYNEIAYKLIENGAISNIPIFSKHTCLSMIDDVKSHTLKIALNRAVR